MKLDVTKIALLLAERGMSKKELAEKSGLSRQSLSTITTRGTCTPRNAGKIAIGLDVHVSEIVMEV